MNDTNLKAYRPRADGRPGTTEIVSGASQNVFRHVTSAERASGTIQVHKIYFGINNTDGAGLISPWVAQHRPTLGATEYVVFWPSAVDTGESDLEAECLASLTRCGSGTLHADAEVGDQTLDVEVKHADQLPGGRHSIFGDGNILRINSHPTAAGAAGSEEFLTVSGAPSVVSGTIVRITTAEPLTSAYTAGTAWVSSCFSESLLEAKSDTPVLTGGVSWDHDANPLQLDNAGTMEEEYTLTFSDGTHFTASGDTLGAIGAGDIGTDFAPVNTGNARPLFTLSAGSLSGASAGDTVVIKTHAAKIAVGEMLVVPAGTASLAGNVSTLVFGGESEG